MNNKKGISAIIATVLIILITIVAVVAVWQAILPMIHSKLNQINKGGICLDAVNQISLIKDGYTCKNTNNISIQISYGSKGFDLADIQVLVYSGGSATAFSIINPTTTLLPTNMNKAKLPNINEEKVYTIDTSGISGNIEKVEIAPVIKIGKTQETCNKASTAILSVC